MLRALTAYAMTQPQLPDNLLDFIRDCIPHVDAAEVLLLLAKQGRHAFALRDLIGATGLDALLSRRVQILSRGQRQRANLARALLHEPELLVLDEPQVGLDAGARAQLESLLKARWPGCTTQRIRLDRDQPLS